MKGAYSDRWTIGRQTVEIRRPWPGEAFLASAWIQRESEFLAAAARKADEVAGLVASGEASREQAEKAVAAFYSQKDGLEGWVIGQLLVGLPPFDREPPANFGRAVMAWLRETRWSPGEAEALYAEVCMPAIASTRQQVIPEHAEVTRLVDFGGPPGDSTTS